jgi:hypothetical protein
MAEPIGFGADGLIDEAVANGFGPLEFASLLNWKPHATR